MKPPAYSRAPFNLRFWLLILMVLWKPVPARAAASAATIERLFGPETKTGAYKHPARAEELADGDLMLVYYGGDGEYAPNTGVFASKLKKGSKSWTSPIRIASDPFRSLGNGVIWQAPDGLVWLFYVVRYGDTWSTSRVQAKVSKDYGNSWSDAFPLVNEEGMMVCNKPIVTASGEYLLPLYFEDGHNTEFTGSGSSGLFFRYQPKTKKWEQTGRIVSASGNIQPVAVELDPGHLIAYCRRGGGYEPTTNGWIVRSESVDGGKTWSQGRNSIFKNPNAAIDFIKLRNGHLLLAFNDSMNDRSPLSLAISTDADKTYPHKRDLATGAHDYAYPMAFQTRDGHIHLIFTSHDRTVINHAVLDEDWVINGGSVKSWMKD